MGFLEIFVRRPVFTTMVIATLVVLGLASFIQLGVDIFPKVDLPTITITTSLQGASPEEIESQITKPIEEVVNTISGLDELRSSTIEGQSQIFATFVLERNVQEAANDVREKVGTVLSRLPVGTDSPIIEKVDPDSSPIIAVVVSGRRSPREITEIADKRVKRTLETVKDVGAITLVGDRKREVQVFADPYKLASFNLSIQHLKDALQRQNVEIPGGRLTSGRTEEGLRTLGRIESVDGFNDLIVADFKGSPVRVHDVATVVDGEEEPRTLSRLNGNTAVSMLIRKQSGTNTVAVVDAVKARLAEIQKGLPQDIRFEVVRDLSRFIKRSFHEVQDHLLLGGLLAADPGYRGPRVPCGQGHEAEFVAYRDKVIDTVLGPVTLTRAWYHCAACRHGLAPRDAELGVEDASMSPGLRAMNDQAAAAGPFAKAARLLENLAGVRLTVKRVERAAEASGTAAATRVWGCWSQATKAPERENPTAPSEAASGERPRSRSQKKAAAAARGMRERSDKFQPHSTPSKRAGQTSGEPRALCELPRSGSPPS